MGLQTPGQESQSASVGSQEIINKGAYQRQGCAVMLVDIFLIGVKLPGPEPGFLVAPCCLQGATLQVTLPCRLVVCPSILFFRIFFHPIFFSPPKKFSHFHFFMHFWMFYAILSAQKNVHPEFFWVKQGVTQCYQAFLVSQGAQTCVVTQQLRVFGLWGRSVCEGDNDGKL